MAAVPVKPAYGPTLGRLLAPRWHAAPAALRWALRGLSAAVLAVLVAAGLTLENSHYSHGGSVPFHFSYRDLYRVRPEPGSFVTVHNRDADGELRYSYSVGPLTLPRYSGEPSAELPLYAVSVIAGLRSRDPGFQLRGEGKTKVNSRTPTGYDVFYTALVEGREMYGRDILLLPERAGARQGVHLVLLSAPGATKQVRSPAEVASVGLLLLPVKSFRFGAGLPLGL
jgi:hypothetical protein